MSHNMKKAGNHCLERTHAMLCLPLCSNAFIFIHSYSLSVLPRSSPLFFPTLQYSCRTWFPRGPKYTVWMSATKRERKMISFQIQNPGEEQWLVQCESGVHSWTNQLWPQKRNILHLNCGSGSHHLTRLEGGVLVSKATGVHYKMWRLKARILERGQGWRFKRARDNREVSVPVRVTRDGSHGRAGGTGLTEEEEHT